MHLRNSIKIIQFIIIYNLIVLSTYLCYQHLVNSIVIDIDFFVKIVLNFILSILFASTVIPRFIKQRSIKIYKDLPIEEWIKIFNSNNYTIDNQTEIKYIFNSSNIFAKVICLGETKIILNIIENGVELIGIEHNISKIKKSIDKTNLIKYN